MSRQLISFKNIVLIFSSCKNRLLYNLELKYSLNPRAYHITTQLIINSLFSIASRQHLEHFWIMTISSNALLDQALFTPISKDAKRSFRNHFISLNVPSFLSKAQ